MHRVYQGEISMKIHLNGRGKGCNFCFGRIAKVNDDQNLKFMKMAYHQALIAYQKGETPVGAIIVKDGKVVSRGYNKREMLKDPTAHAEILAIKKASKKLDSWRLNDCDLYVTLEPCPMCAGAIIQSRIRMVYYGTTDPKAGSGGSVVDLFQMNKFNHRVQSSSGLMQKECSHILKEFFEMLRRTKGNK
jgi:tRNA(adenine34) deaminase